MSSIVEKIFPVPAMPKPPPEIQTDAADQIAAFELMRRRAGKGRAATLLTQRSSPLAGTRSLLGG